MNGQKKWKLSIPLLIIEVLVLMIAIGVLYVITATTSEIERTAIDEDNIIINEEVVETKKEKDIVILRCSAWMHGMESLAGEQEAIPLLLSVSTARTIR